MSARRVVLDTNVVLSALLFATGRMVWVRLAWQERRFLPLVSQETARELLRVLAYPKFSLSAAEQEELLADYLPYCDTVRVPARVAEVPVCRDPHDRAFLRLAVAGRADALVTGDADLLARMFHRKTESDETCALAAASTAAKASARRCAPCSGHAHRRAEGHALNKPLASGARRSPKGGNCIEDDAISGLALKSRARFAILAPHEFREHLLAE